MDMGLSRRHLAAPAIKEKLAQLVSPAQTAKTAATAAPVRPAHPGKTALQHQHKRSLARVLVHLDQQDPQDRMGVRDPLVLKVTLERVQMEADLVLMDHPDHPALQASPAAPEDPDRTVIPAQQLKFPGPPVLLDPPDPPAIPDLKENQVAPEKMVDPADPASPEVLEILARKAALACPEILASLEAVVAQDLATIARAHVPLLDILLSQYL